MHVPRLGIDELGVRYQRSILLTGLGLELSEIDPRSAELELGRAFLSVPEVMRRGQIRPRAGVIDADARFLWLEHPGDCPDAALGFDFDGAAFTHVGERVSFETLLASFELEGDAALMRIGAIVHSLDVGANFGGMAPEAAGLEALLKGLKIRIDDDDRLLDEGGRLLDDLYAAFAEKNGERT